MEASLLLGGVHAIVLAAVLRLRMRHRTANRYLAALLAAVSLLLFDGYLRASGVLVAHPHLIGVTAWVPFVLGPLVYLYVHAMTAPPDSRGHAAWRHLLAPAAVVALLVGTYYLRSASYKLEVARHRGTWNVHALEAGLLVYGIAYAFAALRLLHRHHAHVEQFYSNLRGVTLRWLFVLGVMNALIWIAALVAFVLRVAGAFNSAATSLLVPLGSTITVFVIGYFQLGQAEIHVAPEPPAVTEPPEPPALPDPPEGRESTALPLPTDAAPSDLHSEPAAEPTRDPKPSPAYQRARLAERDAAELEARITAAMTEKRMYQRPGLTLAELADEVAATPHEVSQVLSTRLLRNFYNFVNEHRIDHVKAGLKTTDRSVLDLAYEAGFQSKSTFNSAFRKATGTTPRDFRQRTTS